MATDHALRTEVMITTPDEFRIRPQLPAYDMFARQTRVAEESHPMMIGAGDVEHHQNTRSDQRSLLPRNTSVRIQQSTTLHEVLREPSQCHNLAAVQESQYMSLRLPHTAGQRLLGSYYPPSTRPYAASYSSGPPKRSSSQYSSYDYDDRRGYDNRRPRPSEKSRYKEKRGRDYTERPSQPREQERERSRSSLRPRNPTEPSYGMDPRSDFTPHRKGAKTPGPPSPPPMSAPRPTSYSTTDKTKPAPKDRQYNNEYKGKAQTFSSSSSSRYKYEPNPKDSRKQAYTYMPSRRPQNSQPGPSSHPQDRNSRRNKYSSDRNNGHDPDRRRDSPSRENMKTTDT
ncbi:hypothetical protein QBC37DRAFT_374800 [Rhypophila decipiens]|uniref:Uncharacterized protein n=1 Tax=Rhypophila decipiens TaxID=261697 RepID=A0AAN7B7B4_9PEZI|nr:hypothetical protein QBC37DRAFT_374800 [Rhypophila decipiens]